MGRADDFGPARDDRALHEAEAAERGAADRRHQIGDLARFAAALALDWPGWGRLGSTLRAERGLA
jgi:hypothetical protein